MTEQISILLIEDDDEDALLFKHHLREHSLYQIHHQNSLEQGLEFLHQTKTIDLIILDFGLPDGEGIELIQRIREEFLTPIIVLTGREDDKVGIQAVQSGAQDYLIKSHVEASILEKSIQYTLQRSELQNKIDESKNLQFAELLNSYSDGVFITSEEKNILYLNEVAKSHLEQANVNNDSKFIWPIQHNEDNQIRLKTKEGQNFDISITANKVQWMNQPALIIFTKDISEQMKLYEMEQEIAEKSKEAEIKDEFLRTVSHEIRTPIAIISGAISNLSEGFLGDLNEKQKQVLEIASRNIKQVNLITINSLQLAKLESGKIKLHKSEININEFLKDMNEDFENQVKKADLDFHADNKSDINTFNADENLIIQVFHNLVSNALRYAQSKIRIEASQQDSSLVFSIKNDGPKIPQDKLDTIFQSFSQLKQQKTNQTYKGTGLGLNICKKIVELHGGEIWAENTNEGPAFNFKLPIAIK